MNKEEARQIVSNAWCCGRRSSDPRLPEALKLLGIELSSFRSLELEAGKQTRGLSRVHVLCATGNTR